MRFDVYVTDVRKAIEIPQLYPPNTVADELSRKGKEPVALYALDTARGMLMMRDTVALGALIR